MATAAALARNNRHLRTFEYMQNKILTGIDKRARTKEADVNVMSKHLSGVNEDGERTWTFN